jgi:hypothetical protein
MTESPLNAALRIFEAAEANLVKLEKIWIEMESIIPSGVAFLEDSGYENNCRDFENVLACLPKIDGWKPKIYLMNLNEIGQNRLDAMEVGEIECQISIENQIYEPAKLIREYRHKFDRKRRELVRDALQSAIDSIDEDLRDLAIELEGKSEVNEAVTRSSFDDLKSHIAEVDTLLGSEPRPSRWTDLHRHLHFGLLGDLQDIIKHDWPSVKSGIRKSLYGEKEPIPVEIDDLGSLVSSKPTGPIVIQLKWEGSLQMILRE